SFGRRGIPKDFRDIPRTVAVVNEEAVAERLEFAESAQERFRGGALQERTGLRVDSHAEGIMSRGVTDVEMNSRIQFRKFDKIGLAESTFFSRGSGCEGGVS